MCLKPLKASKHELCKWAILQTTGGIKTGYAELLTDIPRRNTECYKDINNRTTQKKKDMSNVDPIKNLG